MNKEKITSFYIDFINKYNRSNLLNDYASLQTKSDQSQSVLGWAGASLASVLERDENIVFSDHKDHTAEKESRLVNDQLAIIGSANAMLPVKSSSLAVKIFEFCQNFRADFEPLVAKIHSGLTNQLTHMAAKPAVSASGIQTQQGKPAFALSPIRIAQMEGVIAEEKNIKGIRRKRNLSKIHHMVAQLEESEPEKIETASVADEISENLLTMVDGMFENGLNEALKPEPASENSIKFSIVDNLSQQPQQEHEDETPSLNTFG